MENKHTEHWALDSQVSEVHAVTGVGMNTEESSKGDGYI